MEKTHLNWCVAAWLVACSGCAKHEDVSDVDAAIDAGDGRDQGGVARESRTEGGSGGGGGGGGAAESPSTTGSAGEDRAAEGGTGGGAGRAGRGGLLGGAGRGIPG